MQVLASALVSGLAGCATEEGGVPGELSRAARDSASATASGELAVDLLLRGRTTPTVTDTALADMLAQAQDAEVAAATLVIGTAGSRICAPRFWPPCTTGRRRWSGPGPGWRPTSRATGEPRPTPRQLMAATDGRSSPRSPAGSRTWPTGSRPGREAAPRGGARCPDRDRRVPGHRGPGDQRRRRVQVRLSLVWVVLVGVVGICVFAQMSGRVAAVSGRATFEIVRERLGPRVSAANLSASFLINLLTLTAEVGGVALALELASSVEPRLWMPVAAFAVWLVIWRTRFEVMENVTGLVGLCLVVFAVALFLLGPDWSDLADQALTPVVPGTEHVTTYWYYAIALFGAAMTPYEVFFSSSGAVEEG